MIQKPNRSSIQVITRNSERSELTKNDKLLRLKFGNVMKEHPALWQSSDSGYMIESTEKYAWKSVALMMKMSQPKLKTLWFNEQIAFINKYIECGDDESLYEPYQLAYMFLVTEINSKQNFVSVNALVFFDEDTNFVIFFFKDFYMRRDFAQLIANRGNFRKEWILRNVSVEFQTKLLKLCELTLLVQSDRDKCIMHDLLDRSINDAYRHLNISDHGDNGITID